MKIMQFIIAVLGIQIGLFLGVANAQSGGLGPFNNSNYAAISSKVVQAQGDPVNINVNLFLGWTGAWDSVVMKQANLLEQWLPKGSKVEWKRNLQGPPVVTDLLANKQNIAYLGDNPAIVSTTKTSIAPLKIVGFNLISMGRMCGVLLVRSDAPKFNSPEEVFKWLQDVTQRWLGLTIDRKPSIERFGCGIWQ
jgi:NitT/TauT family transport system substrate-binding protein